MRLTQIVTRHYQMYGDSGALLNGFVACYRIWDLDAMLYARWWIAPLIRLAHWWEGARWCVERWSVAWDIRQHGGICTSALLAEGDYYRNHYFHTGELVKRTCYR